MKTPIIAMMTDFGADSHHSGVMKGVIHNILPDVRIVDITHGIEPFNIIQAMYTLDSVISYFPSPTVFLCVVDPGVGSARRPILAVGEKHYYIAPDNGVISRIMKSDEVSRVMHIDETHYFLKNDCQTFHGRDIFAPCAAWFANQLGTDSFGEEIEDYVIINPPKIKIPSDRTLNIPILFVDHFGNLVTNFEPSFMSKARKRFPGKSIKIMAGETLITEIKTHYSEVDNIGDPLAYFGSMNLLEIAVREGNASQKLKLKAGDIISIHLGE